MAKVFTTTQTVSDHSDVRDSWEVMLDLVAPMVPLLDSVKTGNKPRDDQHSWTAEQIKRSGLPGGVLEGDRITPEAAKTADVYRNFSQIYVESGSLSERSQSIDTASKENEMAKQVAFSLKELYQGIEKTFFGRQTGRAESGNNGSRNNSISSYLGSNNFVGNTGGSIGAYNSGTGVGGSFTNGTAYVAFDKDDLNTVLSTIANQPELCRYPSKE